MDEQIKDLEPPVAPLINTAGAVDVAAGALLLVFSDLIHNVIGVVLILFGLYLFSYGRRVRVALTHETEHGGGDGTGGHGSDDPAGTPGYGTDGPS